MAPDGPVAAFAITGANANPRAQSTKISIRVTKIRIGGKGCLSMTAGLSARSEPPVRLQTEVAEMAVIQQVL